MARLTVRSVEAWRPVVGQRQEVPDGYVRGLYLIVHPTGHKVWAVRYRYGGKTRKHTVGPYPVFGLKDARDAAVKVLRIVTEGKDPALSHRIGSFGDTITRFIELHCKDYRARSRRETERLLGHAMHRWGGRRIEEITRADIRSMLGVLAPTPVLANRVHSTLHTLFNWAIENDLIAASPLANIKRPNQETPRDRVLADDELRAVWRAADKEGYPFGRIVQLLALTGQRRSEVAGMAWSEVDLSTGVWTLPKERVKNGRRHLVPLSRQALAILKQLPCIGDKYVFTLNGEVPYANFSRAKARLDPNIAPWTLHDLRRTVASGMARLGVSLVVIEKVLNHISGSLGGIVGVYQRHEYAEEKREALQLWADHVERLVRRDEWGA